MKLILRNEQQLIHSPLYSETSDPPYKLQIVEHAADAYTPLTNGPAIGTTVYTDLLAYPFALKLQKIVDAQTVCKGVVRFRRTAQQFSVAEDLYALSRLFGDVQHVTVREREVLNIRYIIVLCKLGNVMAHVEYVTGDARIEFEWSSDEHILEFDSATMFGDVANNRTLAYQLEAILKQAHIWDEQQAALYAELEQLVQGGERV